MGKGYKYYLTCDLEELKSEESKNDLINSANKYEIVRFCQESDLERLMTLLDEEGIEMLIHSSDIETKLNGILTCGKDIPLLKNESFCEIVLKKRDWEDAWAFGENMAKDMLNYLEKANKDKMLSFYFNFQEKVQVAILQENNLEELDKIELLMGSRKEAAEWILSNRTVQLEDLKLEIIEGLADKKVKIPNEKMTTKFQRNLSEIFDVNRYRFLMEQFSLENDVDEIEKMRKEFYQKQFENIQEDGLLKPFHLLKEMLEEGKDLEEIGEKIPELKIHNRMLYEISGEVNQEKKIKEWNDYFIANMVMDGLFEDIPTNVLKNIHSLLSYQNENPFLEEKTATLYEILEKIDFLDNQRKVKLWEELKDKNTKEMFYDNFSTARELVAHQINECVINEQKMQDYLDENATATYGVPICRLTGENFYVIARNIGAYKNDILPEKGLDFLSDGSSFSIDGSNMISTYGDIKSTYTLVYSRIPEKQLIHIFLADAFTRYERDFEMDIPKNDDKATKRVLQLVSPEELTSTYSTYNEVLVAVPNKQKEWMKNGEKNEFESQLEKPKAFAIYCYDEITENDIESAKKYGLGIIIVDTKSYNINRDGRKNVYDTLSYGKDEKKNNYLSKRERDERETLGR